jgi:hypothetical protein
MKVTAQRLEEAGYTQDQIDRYYKLLNRKTKLGLDALTVNDRRFYNKCRVDNHKMEALRIKQLAAAKTRVVSGKQPVETKLHYRWIETDLALLNQLTDLAPGEVNATAILLEEELRALRKYQPVLDQVDTSKRGKTLPVTQSMLEYARVYGRVAMFDYDTYVQELKKAFPEHTANWDVNDEKCFYRNRAYRSIVLIPDSLERGFREMVQDEMDLVVRTAFPSVEASV